MPNLPARPTGRPAPWWLTLYPHLSTRAKRHLAALCLTSAMLAQSAASYARPVASTPVAPPASDAYARPAVQNALRELGLPTVASATPVIPAALPAGTEFQVNTYTTNAQLYADIAQDGDGDFVVVWGSNGSAGSDTLGYSIQAQRFDALGIAQGAQFQVNTYTTNNQVHPRVALDTDGDFVVVWGSLGSVGSDISFYSIAGQRYNSVGTAQGAEFLVNTYTTGNQRDPDVALDGAGDFVVTWSTNASSGLDTLGYSIQAQRYNALGTAQGAQFEVNTYTTSDQAYSSVSLDNDGDFVVVWHSTGSAGTDTLSNSIQGQRFNSVATAQGTQFQVNTLTVGAQRFPSVALDGDGDFVVVWAATTASIRGQRYNSAGTAQGVEFIANTYVGVNHTYPSVALSDAGDFVVTWQSYGSPSTDALSWSVQGQRYSSGGAPLDLQFQINTYTTSAQRNPVVALDSDGDFVVAWHSTGSSGTDTLNTSVQAQRFTVPHTNWQVNTYTTSAQINGKVAMDADGDFVVVWASNGSNGTDTLLYSIQAQRYNSVGTAQGAQFQVNTYTTNSQFYPAVSLDSNGDFVVVWYSNGSTGTDSLSYSIQAQRYNSVGTPQGTQFQVNTYTTGSQRFADVALDSTGNFVIAWDSSASGGTDTLSYSVQAQRYNSVGTAQGAQFQVNTYTTGGQQLPALALASTGNFVIAWQSAGSGTTDTLGNSIQAQRYNSVGTAQGTQFQVNTYTTSNQRTPDVALDSTGNFVVVWESQGASSSDTNGYSVQAQRYNSVGTAQGTDFQVNTYTTSDQRFADVALDSDGDFIVVWQSIGSDSGDTLALSVHGRLFSKAGVPLFGQFRLNTYTTNSQGVPAVAVDSNGDIIAVWQSGGSYGPDSLGNSIQAARFDLGQTDFQVNNYTTSQQLYANVAVDSAGDFVIVWESQGSSGTDTGNYSIQARLFNPDGTPKANQFQVNTYTTGSQRFPDVALDAAGDFIVVWQSAGSSSGDTSSTSVQAQRYNSVGTAQGAQFQVNTFTTSFQSLPVVTADSGGDFVVAWQSNGSSGTDTLSYSIQAKRYNSAGTVQGVQFQVNTYTTSSQSFPAITSDDDGDFVIAWQSNGSSGADTNFNSIQAQRYNSIGAAQGTNFQVNTYTTDNQTYSGVAADSDGDFVVVWASYGSSGTDTSSYSIQGQRFNSVGTAQGTQFQVNTYTTSTQYVPGVSLDAEGDFVVTWNSNGSSGNDTLLDSVQAQRYNSIGTAQGTQFQVNAYTTSMQRAPTVAMDSAGNFVVAWHTNGITAPPFSPTAPSEKGLSGDAPLDDTGYAIAASRFSVLGGAEPTALHDGAAHVTTQDLASLRLVALGALGALGALAAAAWARVRRR